MKIMPFAALALVTAVASVPTPSNATAILVDGRKVEVVEPGKPLETVHVTEGFVTTVLVRNADGSIPEIESFSAGRKGFALTLGFASDFTIETGLSDKLTNVNLWIKGRPEPISFLLSSERGAPVDLVKTITVH